MSVGFHTRQELKKAVRRPKANTVPIEVIRKMGWRAVKNMNPKARSPNLEPDGPDDADLYVLGTWPHAEEDRQGLAWGHRQGLPVTKVARRIKTRFSHVVRTMPPDERPPKDHEVIAFERELTEDIEATKPRVILACGNLAFQFLQPGIASNMRSNMAIHRGRHFPVRVGKHECWAVPTFSMAEYALLTTKGDKGCRDGKEWQLFLDNDIRDAVKLAKRSKPPYVETHDVDAILKAAKVVITYDPHEIIALIDKWANTPGICAIDYETTGGRSYGKGARIQTLSITTDFGTLTFPVEHERMDWRGMWDEFLDSFWEFLQVYEVIAHGLEHENEWTLHLFRDRLAARVAKQWHCTLVQAFVLAPRVGHVQGDESGVSGLSLDYLCRLHFGFPLKKLSRGELWKERHALDELLQYNALDTIFTYDIYFIQREEIFDRKQLDLYYRHIRRIPTAVLAQHDGVPCSQDRVVELGNKYRSKMQVPLDKLAQLDEVRRFKSQFGMTFNVASPDHVLKLFRTVLGHEIPSTQESALSPLKDVEFAAKYILEYRKPAKIHSTYLWPIDKRNPKHHIQPDGLIHCRFHTTRTVTGRVSSSDPNMTNQPERTEGKEIKEAFEAPTGLEWYAFDYGQIEARVLAMAARDAVFCDALWQGDDVHRIWAEKVARTFPGIFKRDFSGDIEELRSAIKNKLVFPWFFGAGIASVAKSLRVDPEELKPLQEEFWDTFRESKQWQERLLRGFKRNLYVETLTGRRRYGPMSYNAKINMPIQGTAADIVFDAWDRISERAEKTENIWLAPRLMVHDDLKFLAPKNKADELLDIVPRMMCQVPFDFVNVPMVIEATRGPNLAEMPKIAQFSSEDF